MPQPIEKSLSPPCPRGSDFVYCEECRFPPFGLFVRAPPAPLLLTRSRNVTDLHAPGADGARVLDADLQRVQHPDLGEQRNHLQFIRWNAELTPVVGRHTRTNAGRGHREGRHRETDEKRNRSQTRSFHYNLLI